MAAGPTGNTINPRDLEFLLYEWLDLERLLTRERFAEHSRETVDAVLAISQRLAADKFLSHYKASDASEPQLTPEGVKVLPAIHEALRECAEVGLFAAPFAEELGGLQVPQVVFSACEAPLMSANIATAAYLMLTVANARLIAAFGTPAQIEAFAKPQIEGRWLGTMCLSEPQAGSSLADTKTRAVPDGEDELGRRFRLFGNKMWISGGDHDITENIVHLVLAKVPADDDKGGRLSLFIVPKQVPGDDGEAVRNDIAVGGLNHKMGYRGTSNCLLNFGEGGRRPYGEAGAVGYLVGEIGQGLAIMFHMMNEARIGVGLGAAMLGYRGYLHALQYAQERIQGRPLKRDSERPGAVAIVEHPDVRRMLLAQKAYSEGGLALVLYCARLVDDTQTHPDSAARDEAAELLGLLTPVAKTWPSEYGLLSNDLAIQIHGGYGYTRDFDVEQLYRDNRLNPIHEGTTGIQALDLLGRKVLRDEGQGLRRLLTRVRASVAAARESQRLAPDADAVAQVWGDIETRADALIGLEDHTGALANATYFLWAFGHAVLSWLWLEQAQAAEKALATGLDTAFYEGKLYACRFFCETELPRVAHWLSLVEPTNTVAMQIPLESF